MPTDASLVDLAVSWLVLCTGLVMKHLELVTIFAAFVASFMLAICFGMFRPAPQTLALSLSPLAATAATSIRHTVGIIMYTAALAALALWDNEHVGSNNNGNSDSTNAVTMMASLSTIPTTSADFLALSISAGYLAFDHWYTALHGYLRKSLWRVIEDAVSLSALCTVVATWPANQLGQYRTFTTVWLVYQLVRLAVVGVPSLSTTSDIAPACDKSKLATPRRTTMAPVKPVPATTPDEQQSLWFIQGQAYDLRNFVHRHPGGREALLLGQGRQDCTALVLSYHPFSLAQVQQTLAKYRVVPISNNNGSRTSKGMVYGSSPDRFATTPTRDAFYEVLCQRVQQELQSQGLDPWNQRAANAGRVFYYTTMAMLVLASGYAHAVQVGTMHMTCQ